MALNKLLKSFLFIVVALFVAALLIVASLIIKEIPDARRKALCKEGLFVKRCSYTPTTEELKAYEIARNETLSLFDSLPKLSETEFPLLMPGTTDPLFKGRHEVSINGEYQAKNAWLEATAFSKLSTEEICRAYLAVFQRTPSRWGVGLPFLAHEPLSLDKDYCSKNTSVSVREIPSSAVQVTRHYLSFYNLETQNSGGLFTFEFSAESAKLLRDSTPPGQAPNPHFGQSQIKVEIIYQVNEQEASRCTVDNKLPDDQPCVQSSWGENGVR